MLPGFRFLFAAILLSMSMLIFGLGAAALLRAAHEEFASIPSRRPPPEPLFAQRSDAGPTLAMLRVEPSAADESAISPPTAGPAPDPMGLAPTAVEEPAAELDTVVALDMAAPLEDSSPLDASTSETATPEIRIDPERPSVQANDDTSSSDATAKVAAIAEVTAAAPDQSGPAKPDRPSAPIDDSSRIAGTRIATLGGPPVTVGTQRPSKIAPVVVKKSAQARRPVKRRRITQRSPMTQQAPQTPADPFAQPFGR